MRTYRMSVSTAPLVALGARWRLVAKFQLRPIDPRKRTPVPIEQEARCGGGGQKRSGRFGEEESLLTLPAFDTQIVQALA